MCSERSSLFALDFRPNPTPFRMTYRSQCLLAYHPLAAIARARAPAMPPRKAAYVPSGEDGLWDGAPGWAASIAAGGSLTIPPTPPWWTGVPVGCGVLVLVGGIGVLVLVGVGVGVPSCPRTEPSPPREEAKQYYANDRCCCEEDNENPSHG